MEAIAALINEAYLVERFFVEGPRITAEAIEEFVGLGEILVLRSAKEELLASAHIRCQAGSGHLGLIAVSSSNQGRGFGRRIIAACEQTARSSGCALMQIQVVNLRPELPTFYQRLGYIKSGTSAFAEKERVIQPVHFIDMQKALTQA